jgi:hypothetical protein
MTDLNKPITRNTKRTPAHGARPLVITLYPGGTIGLREQGRRKQTEVCLDSGRLYLRAVENRIAVERMNKAKKRAQERKLRKELR